jgi:hypothetical protein
MRGRINGLAMGAGKHTGSAHAPTRSNPGILPPLDSAAAAALPAAGADHFAVTVFGCVKNWTPALPYMCKSPTKLPRQPVKLHSDVVIRQTGQLLDRYAPSMWNPYSQHVPYGSRQLSWQQRNKACTYLIMMKPVECTLLENICAQSKPTS